MSRIKQVIQHDETDCAAACLSIVLQYYGKYIPLRKIRQACCTDIRGTSGMGIVKGAKEYGLSCKGIVSPEKEGLSTTPLPAIFHLNRKTEHFVVVYRKDENYVYVSDPAIGKRKIRIQEFMDAWSGVFFILFPELHFEKYDKESGVLSRFFQLLKPHKYLMIQVVLASLLLSIFGIFISFYFRFLIDEVLYSEIKSTLNICSLCYLLVLIFQAFLSFCRNQIILYLGQKIDIMLTGDFFDHLLHLPLSFFSSRKTGEILSRMDDAETIRDAVSSTTLSVIIDSFMLVIGGAFLFKMGSVLLPVAIVPVVISSVIVWLFAGPFKKLIRQRAVIEAEKNGSMYESINGIATVKGLSTENLASERVEDRIVEAAHTSVRLGKMGNIQNTLLELISGIGTLALYWAGSNYIFAGKMSLGQLISFITLSVFFLGPLKRLLTMQLYLQEIGISAERLSDILDMQEEENDERKKTEAEKLRGDITFENVTFSYGTRGRAVEDVNFTIPAGKKVAFVGMSGSGKTTLLKLLMKFYHCSEGKILVNGTDIEDYDTSSYRTKIGYVPQESFLFSGTIAENIAWGAANPDPKRIMGCAAASRSLDFIDRMPDKFNNYVGESGSTLSGGERQRLALARVLMRNPDFMILDEATASLDSISERYIMNTVFKHIHDRTVIIVAHRLSTIKNCDIIFVFNKGHLVEQGDHRTLIAKRGHYFKLWSAQNGQSIETAT